MRNLTTALIGLGAIAGTLSTIGTASAEDLKVALIHGRTGALEAYAKQTETGLRLGFEYATKGTMTCRRSQDRHHHQGRPVETRSRQDRARRSL